MQMTFPRLGSSPPAIVAIDLGAESCRVTLLEWKSGVPHIDPVHRFANAPVEHNGGLHWDLNRVLSELEQGLRRCADRVSGPIASVGVDGWAVDYVRLGEDGLPFALPFCYRDARTEAAEREVLQRISAFQLFQMSGAQPLRINTLYQLIADRRAGVPNHAPWINLPEYVLSRLGGRAVSEYTNAAHTGLLDVRAQQWNSEIFDIFALDVTSAPELVPPGTSLGKLQGSLASLPPFADTQLIAPACHDTASAIAGIAMDGTDWAYISSGTWSLVGTLLDEPLTTGESCKAGFTNLCAAGGRICFHRNVNGMWLLKQCMTHLCDETNAWSVPELIAAAERLPAPDHLLEVDDPPLLLAGQMASRINAQRHQHGWEPIAEHPSAMPQFANLIFHSMAHQYAKVVDNITALTGKPLRRVAIVGGGSLNRYLNRLTAEATGLEVVCGIPESATVGNLAVQLATLDGGANAPRAIAQWARRLTESFQS